MEPYYWKLDIFNMWEKFMETSSEVPSSSKALSLVQLSSSFIRMICMTECLPLIASVRMYVDDTKVRQRVHQNNDQRIPHRAANELLSRAWHNKIAFHPPNNSLSYQYTAVTILTIITDRTCYGRGGGHIFICTTWYWLNNKYSARIISLWYFLSDLQKNKRSRQSITYTNDLLACLGI
jgi:hypothetical protein